MPNLIPPEQPVANLEYRKELRKWASKSQVNRDWIIEKCREDFFWWLKSFAFIYEPRPRDGKKSILPFIPWSSQVPVFETILKNLGYTDIGLEKSRGEGATWIVICIFVWVWLFHPEKKDFGLVSKDRDSADDPNNLSSLGAKVDFLLETMPQWMSGKKGKPKDDGDWERNITRSTWHNRRNGSIIYATATTAEMFSGARLTALMMDEFAKFPRGDDEAALSSTAPVTDCRILVSTYNGCDGAYYKCMKEPSSMVKICMPWMNNPTRNQFMFCIDGKNGRLLKPGTTEPILVGEYTDKFFGELRKILQHRSFDVESISKVWSPWYVNECCRGGMTPRMIAQEYDMDPEGAGNNFSPPQLIERCCARARKPDTIGEVEYGEDLTVTRFMTSKTGRFKLWFDLQTHKALPPLGNYVVGVDIAMGLGTCWTSNSVISVANRDTGKKVAEYCSHTTGPERLAELAIAVCRWFMNADGGPAYLIWENNGTGGGAFRLRILDSNFRNFHWHTPWNSSKKKPTKDPGWQSSKTSKNGMLSKYRWSLTEGFFENPSEEALNECSHYQVCAGDKVMYIAGTTDDNDPMNSNENHGDRVIADALANLAMEELGGGAAGQINNPRIKRGNFNPPEGSFGYRQKIRQEKDRLMMKKSMRLRLRDW